MKRVLASLLALALVCVPALTAAIHSPLILVSLDGFRWDYTELYPAESPTLRTLQRDGASARALVPVFPSNTFPNHYTIVTGLYPANHGMVNNDFFDPNLGVYFHFNQPGSGRDARWWGGEPIWVTAIKQGRKAAAAFWVGSEVAIDGVRPNFWHPFDPGMPFEKRLDELVGWLELPAAERPDVVVFYLEETNGAGHRYGPNSPEVAAAVKLCDDRIATMLARLRARKIEPNLLIVSDHGMAATALERVVFLEDHVEPASFHVDSGGSVAALRPVNGDAAALVRAFKNVPHVKAFLAEDLPARFQLRGNPRIAPVWVLPEEGWHAVTRSTFDRLRTNYRVRGYLQGDHGYDPASPNMHGVLIAHGPAFRPGAVHPPAENIHLYNLMCAVLKLKPAKNDGDHRLAKALLK
jgi:predicted AlkP superfamily pyrophosphatase or phosphodiesterase